MKRFSLFLAFCLAMTSFAFATTNNSTDGDPIIHVKSVDAKSFQVTLANLQQLPTSVSLTNLRGTTFFKETIRKHNGYAKKLDLNKMPKGRYLLNVKQGEEVFSKVIYIDGKSMRISGLTK